MQTFRGDMVQWHKQKMMSEEKVSTLVRHPRAFSGEIKAVLNREVSSFQGLSKKEALLNREVTSFHFVLRDLQLVWPAQCRAPRSTV